MSLFLLHKRKQIN